MAELTGWAAVGLGVVSAVFGGGGVWTMLAARQKARAEAPAQAAKAETDLSGAAADFARAIGEVSAGMMAELRQEVTGLRTECHELRVKVEHCETRHGDCERHLSEVREEVARLMRENPPAAYELDSQGRLRFPPG